MYQTVVTWDPLATTEEKASIQAKSDEMKAAGKTDGVSVTTWPGGVPGEAPQVATRTWANEADAQEWETFLYTLVPPPASVTISIV